MFANDYFLFMQFKGEEVWCLQWLLNAFCEHSGLRINISKSELYLSPNFGGRERGILDSCFRFKVVPNPGIYLGASLNYSGRTKREVFNILVENLSRKLQGWKCKLLTFAGRCIMVKHVLQAVPIYLMSVFKIPSGVLQKMNTIIRRFLWQLDLGHGMFWKKWDNFSS